MRQHRCADNIEWGGGKGHGARGMGRYISGADLEVTTASFLDGGQIQQEGSSIEQRQRFYIFRLACTNPKC